MNHPSAISAIPIPIIITIACTFTFPSTAFSAPDVSISQSGNTYISGASVRITTPVPADLVAAGGRISVEREVGADATLAGGTVDVRAPVREDLRAAGGTVDLDAAIGGDLAAAGGNVQLERTAAVAGSTWLTGGNVTVAGTLAKGANIYANKLTVSGTINGDAHLVAREIHFLPGTKITGNLSYASQKPLATEELAYVSGMVRRDALPDNVAGRDNRPALFWAAPVFILAMLAAGTLLRLFFPAAVEGTQRAIMQSPLRSFLIGLALLFAVPPVAIFLMATIIGIPIGLTCLALYPVMLLLGYLVAGFYIGRRVAGAMKQPAPLAFGREILMFTLALVLLSLVVWIPFLGMLVVMVALVIGIGGWATWMFPGQDNRAIEAAPTGPATSA